VSAREDRPRAPAVVGVWSPLPVYRFGGPDQRHVFDGSSGEILRVSELIHDVVGAWGQRCARETRSRLARRYSPTEIHDAFRWVSWMQVANNMLLPFTECETADFPPWEAEVLEGKLDCECRQLVLELTQACNLRCSSCTFGRAYAAARGYPAISMSPQIAESAIDFLADHSASQNRVDISFYGGEPLLEWPLLAECLLYARGRLGERVHFSVSTNGTLLRPEMGRVLAQAGVQLWVSVDGPEDIHDRYRRTSSAEPTFAIVAQGLRALRRAVPTWYSKNVHLQCVTGPAQEWERLEAFFASTDLYDKGALLSVTPVRRKDCVVAGLLLGDQSSSRRKDWVHDRVLSHARALPFCPPAQEFEEDEAEASRWQHGRFALAAADLGALVAIHRRSVASPDSPGPPSRCCIPGLSRLYVSATGEFYPCERVRVGSAVMCIGDVWRGFDAARVAGLMREFHDLNADECPRCWARRLCNLCLAHVSCGPGSGSDRKAAACDGVRRSLAAGLEMYVTLWADAPAFLDRLCTMTSEC